MLDLSSKVGQSLYQEGSKPLDAKFSGKPEELFVFIANLKRRTQECYWNSAAHGILTITVNGEYLNLLGDYGQLTTAQVEAARVIRDAGANNRSRQNALMMSKCVYDSLTDHARTGLISEGVPQDGPTLVYQVVTATFTATFLHAQATRNALQALSPKTFQYDIRKVNNYARVAFNAIRSALQNGQEVSNQEALFYFLTAYKKIKTPKAWLFHITFLESQAGSLSNYPFTTLMAEGAKKYSDLKDTGEWKPSDKSPEEHILAMFAQSKADQSKGNSRGETQGRGGRGGRSTTTTNPARPLPPFSEEKGKEGDTREWEGKTWNYCS
jgi:hypothetical protein